MKIRSITQLPKKLNGKRVIVRADLNVPVHRGRVVDSSRLRALVPTLQFLKSRGARVVVISHFGDGVASLRPVAQSLARFFHVRFSDVPFKNAHGVVESLKSGEVVVLENLRKNRGEKKNDKKFAKTIARLGDIYVNDAFSASHRAHASIVSLPKLLPAYAGLLFMEEYEGLSRAQKPTHPFLFIVGGAKGETKMPLLMKYLRRADQVFVGGALANDFFKANGLETGVSITSSFKIPRSLLRNKKIILPIDVTIHQGDRCCTISPAVVKKNMLICDAGPASVGLLGEMVNRAGTIVFNGPLGDYEKGCALGTEKILKAIAASKARSILGGGDTLVLIQRLGLEKKFTFVSKSGGAMLEFLADGTLPGINALEKGRK